jgi:hypothetical protein
MAANFQLAVDELVPSPAAAAPATPERNPRRETAAAAADDTQTTQVATTYVPKDIDYAGEDSELWPQQSRDTANDDAQTLLLKVKHHLNVELNDDPQNYVEVDDDGQLVIQTPPFVDFYEAFEHAFQMSTTEHRPKLWGVKIDATLIPKTQTGQLTDRIANKYKVLARRLIAADVGHVMDALRYLWTWTPPKDSIERADDKAANNNDMPTAPGTAASPVRQSVNPPSSRQPTRRQSDEDDFGFAVFEGRRHSRDGTGAPRQVAQLPSPVPPTAPDSYDGVDEPDVYDLKTRHEEEDFGEGDGSQPMDTNADAADAQRQHVQQGDDEPGNRESFTDLQPTRLQKQPMDTRMDASSQQTTVDETVDDVTATLLSTVTAAVAGQEPPAPPEHETLAEMIDRLDREVTGTLAPMAAQVDAIRPGHARPGDLYALGQALVNLHSNTRIVAADAAAVETAARGRIQEIEFTDKAALAAMESRSRQRARHAQEVIDQYEQLRDDAVRDEAEYTQRRINYKSKLS